MTVFAWLRRTLAPVVCTSETFIYDDMDSQSGHALPHIYRPFDITKRAHWRDRGSLFDYLLATEGVNRRLLDFGPGDGWPSLIVAPYARRVTGVDASQRRAAVCRENARRMGIDNADFVAVASRTQLPFADDAFDGVMAATSIEQTPSPRDTLRELWRVLRPGGRLRMSYEALGGYRGGREQDLWLWPIDDRHCRLILFDRRVDDEIVDQVGLTFSLPAAALREHFSGRGDRLVFADVTIEKLESCRSHLVDARLCTTVHPSGATWAKWLREAGFRLVHPTKSGAAMAGDFFDAYPRELHPQTLEELDRNLKLIAAVAIQIAAPLEDDPMLTAIK